MIRSFSLEHLSKFECLCLLISMVIQSISRTPTELLSVSPTERSLLLLQCVTGVQYSEHTLVQQALTNIC